MISLYTKSLYMILYMISLYKTLYMASLYMIYPLYTGQFSYLLGWCQYIHRLPTKSQPTLSSIWKHLWFWTAKLLVLMWHRGFGYFSPAVTCLLWAFSVNVFVAIVLVSLRIWCHDLMDLGVSLDWLHVAVGIVLLVSLNAVSLSPSSLLSCQIW